MTDNTAIMPPLRRLPLQGTQNTRDLGGYPCPGGATQWHRFVRSDNPLALTKEDMDTLLRYGITESVDLRRAEEGEQQPSALHLSPAFQAHHVSVTDDLTNMDFQGDVPGSMAGLYIDILDKSSRQLAEVMMYMAQAKGGVLFHCAVGKDRTGVVAMLLLKLAGVADTDVVADYAMTEIYMKEIFDAQSVVFKDTKIPDYIMRSIPASMERTLAHLQEQYGTAEDYLLGAGLPQSEVNCLKAKLTE